MRQCAISHAPNLKTAAFIKKLAHWDIPYVKPLIGAFFNESLIEDKANKKEEFRKKNIFCHETEGNLDNFSFSYHPYFQ